MNENWFAETLVGKYKYLVRLSSKTAIENLFAEPFDYILAPKSTMCLFQ